MRLRTNSIERKTTTDVGTFLGLLIDGCTLITTIIFGILGLVLANNNQKK